MEILLQPYIEHFFASIVVFAFLFIIIAYLFARERFIPMLDGLAGVVLSFFSCPFIYMKAAVLSMADYRAKNEAVNSTSKQYLLNKVMFFMQAALIVVSIAVFAGSLTTGWIAMVPPKYLRDEVRSTNAAVVQQNADLKKLEPAVKQLEETWKNQRDAEMGNFAAERTEKIDKLKKENADLVNLINNVDPQTKMLFAKIEEFHARHASALTKGELDSNINTMNDYLSGLRVTDGAKTLMRSHSDNWGSLMRLKMEINNISEKEVRAASQPTYKKLSGDLEGLRQELLAKESRLAGLKIEAAYKINRLLLGVLSGSIMFMLLVWLFGLLIEVLWSAINVSTDVKEIQNVLLKPKDL